MLKRNIIIIITLAILWQLFVWLFHLPNYILPGPTKVLISFLQNFTLIAQQAIPTIIEALLGFFFGSLFGAIGALLLIYYRPARLWFLPLLLLSQALPTFAIAPLFVIWFGYGMASKIAVTILMLFFPVTSSFYDGLKATPQAYLDLAQISSASRWQTLWQLQVPAALPKLASGLRIAATFAPMGAVIGEWVGSAKGLGFLMLNSNARMQISLMFAALLTVVALTLLFYFLVDRTLKRLVWW